MPTFCNSIYICSSQVFVILSNNYSFNYLLPRCNNTGSRFRSDIIVQVIKTGVVECYENYEHFVTLAHSLYIWRTTPYSIVRLYQQQGSIAGSQIKFLVPKDVHCSKTYAKPIFIFFCIFSFNKIFILSFWHGDFSTKNSDNKFSFTPILINIFLDTFQKILMKRGKLFFQKIQFLRISFNY